MTTTQVTVGQTLTAALRRYFSVGPRTRRYRKGMDLHVEMVEAIMCAAQYPGYFTERTEAALRPGFGTALAYEKHVGGCRIDGELRMRISDLTPWHFATLLGEMLDAGVTNTGSGEQFFSEMARAA
jgi:hypothetical protein